MKSSFKLSLSWNISHISAFLPQFDHFEGHFFLLTVILIVVILPRDMMVRLPNGRVYILCVRLCYRDLERTESLSHLRYRVIWVLNPPPNLQIFCLMSLLYFAVNLICVHFIFVKVSKLNHVYPSARGITKIWKNLCRFILFHFVLLS